MSGTREACVALTENFDVAGGDGFTDSVDGLAGVDAGVVLTEAGDLQRHVTEVKGTADTSACEGKL